jgi:hypothetical protein
MSIQIVLCFLFERKKYVYITYHWITVVPICTTLFNNNNASLFPWRLFTSFICFSEWTLALSLISNNWFVFVIQILCHFCMVGTEFLKTAVFWDVMPCGSCKNQCFGGTYLPHHQDERISELGTLAVTSHWSTLWRAAFICSMLIIFTLMIEANTFLWNIGSYKSHTVSQCPSVPEDGILHNDYCENLKSYICF